MSLRFAYPEHLRPAGRADSLGGGPPILQGDGLRALNLPRGSAFEAISGHEYTPLKLQLARTLPVGPRGRNRDSQIEYQFRGELQAKIGQHKFDQPVNVLASPQLEVESHLVKQGLNSLP